MLGDTISLSVTGIAGPYTDIMGWIIFAEAGIDTSGLGIAELDELRQRARFKVSKAILPDIKVAWRIRTPLLGVGVTWKMSGNQGATEGRYWLLDIQKATT